MKNILVTLALVLTCSMVLAIDFQVCGGVDLGTIVDSDGFLGNDALVFGAKYQPGFNLSLQSLVNSNNILYGVGADYQFERKHKKLPEGWTTSLEYLSFVPVYAVLGYRFPVTSGPVPEFYCQAGYSLALIEDAKDEDIFETEEYEYSGGGYYAFGFGLDFQNFLVQALFRYNTLRYKETEFQNGLLVDKRENDMTCRHFTIQLGKRF
ncbi:MAG: outer membrane beta-barrel protein [Candidatus Cloacimonetes bacterium]|nr:outer membrane beta-barrel protein [Candidatus Cloacimonadota bacterium]